MKTIGKTAAILAACTLGATAAFAQTDTSPTMTPQTEAPQTATPPAAAPAPATPSTPEATSASFTDADVDQFATAVIAVQKIQADSTVAATDKQTRMAAAVQQSGLTPDKFNSMAQTSQSDPALMKRVQTAAAAKMPAAPAAPPAPAAPGGATGGAQ